MSMSPGIVDATIYSKLTGDATLVAALPGGVWSTRPPVDNPFPYLRFTLRPSPDERWTLGGSRILRFRYQVDVADKGDSTDAANSALARADTLLSDASFSPSSGAILSCRREGFTGNRPEEVSGVRYQMVGATYLIEAIP